MYATSTINRVLQETLTVAAAFWALCLVLVSLEATVGSNALIGFAFLISIPMLVGSLFWAHRPLLPRPPAGFSAMLVAGTSVLVSSSLIILLGLVAATNLKHLLTGV